MSDNIKILLPNLRAIKYVGELPTRFFQAGTPEVPTLNNGDVVVVSLVAATLLTRQKNYEFYQENKPLIELAGDSFASENKETNILQNSLHAELDDLNAKLIEAMAQNDSFVMAVNDTNEKMAMQAAEHKKLLDNANQELEAVKNQNSELALQNEELAKQIANFEQNASSLQTNESQSEIDELKAQIAKLKDENIFLNKQIATQTSKSKSSK